MPQRFSRTTADRFDLSYGSPFSVLLVPSAAPRPLVAMTPDCRQATMQRFPQGSSADRVRIAFNRPYRRAGSNIPERGLLAASGIKLELRRSLNSGGVKGRRKEIAAGGQILTLRAGYPAPSRRRL